MLLLRTASLEKKEESWFIVNSTPIIYSLREMALISGLYCHDYPRAVLSLSKPGKQAPSVEPFFLRAIDDLDKCKTFPWGRLDFDENMKDIFHCMNHFRGVLSTQQWVFPSFVIPLENVLVMHMHTVIVLGCAR
ncbi:hypothetical protein CARUB_v10018828mg [Capsella rubella]|uniref:DUF1985 domain-containing protein n=1 Tax=Capsella rubella TaxID=81985 RepID=R0H868_9BRAS|nr:hypothetical protein CARUB_v10018828mg [Capsella rubella]